MGIPQIVMSVHQYDATPIAPQIAKPLTSKTHNDVYSAISPTGGLSGSAADISVLITGAGRGIGRSAAIAFSQAGAKKVVLISRSQTQLDEVEQAIEAAVGKGTVQIIKAPGDVTEQANVESIFDKSGSLNGESLYASEGYTNRFYPSLVLINNAG